MEWRLGLICVENAIWLLGFFWCCCVFCERKDCSCTLYSSLIIVKSLQFRGHRQIAKPCKYCLVRVIVFFDVCFFYFFVSHRLGIWVNSLQLVSEPGVRFEWEQW